MDLTLEQAAGQAIITGFAGTEPEPDLLAWLAEGALGGVIHFKRNVSPDVVAIADANRRIVQAAPAELPPIVAVDQEGGRVARLGPPVLALPPMRRLGDIDDVVLTRRAARALAVGLRALGFNMDFAPVMDVDSNPKNPVIGDRAFGRDVRVVARHGVAFIEGLQAGNVLACAKHFPGHGDTETDSHHALPRVTHARARLDEVELPPFRAAAGAGVAAVMTAHVVFDDLDAGVPATLSRSIVGSLLRMEMAFDGIIVSDDLEMRALADRMSVGEAAVRALEAGCDALLVCSGIGPAREAQAAIVRAAEKDDRLSRRLAESARRSLRARRLAPAKPETQPLALMSILNAPSVTEFAAELAARLR